MIGFAGNWIAARIRTRAGRRLDSPALIADGDHARADAYVSLAVVASAAVVAIGLPIADPLIGLAITLVILRITWHSWQTIRHDSPHQHTHSTRSTHPARTRPARTGNSRHEAVNDTPTATAHKRRCNPSHAPRCDRKSSADQMHCVALSHQPRLPSTPLAGALTAERRTTGAHRWLRRRPLRRRRARSSASGKPTPAPRRRRTRPAAERAAGSCASGAER